jgi:hypothetical protein
MSDGIFEFLDSQAVLAEVHAAASAGQPPSEAAKRLVAMARRCVRAARRLRWHAGRP